MLSFGATPHRLVYLPLEEWRRVERETRGGVEKVEVRS